MACTPLFHLLQRAARIARASTRTRGPLAEFYDRGRALRVDAVRRRVHTATRDLEPPKPGVMPMLDELVSIVLHCSVQRE